MFIRNLLNFTNSQTKRKTVRRAALAPPTFAPRLESLEARTVPVTWNSTSLSLFGQYVGASVTPNGHFFATAGFEIKRSTDVGATWQNVSPANLFAASSIAYAPSNPSTLIAGRFGSGALKSVDGGTNWFALSGVFGGPRCVVFQPDNENTVYAGSKSGFGLYKSVNGGATWTNPLMSKDVFAVAIDPQYPQTVYVASQTYSSYSGGLLKSSDGGSSWSSMLPTIQGSAVAVNPNNSQVVFVGTADGGVYKSTNGGTTWTETTGSSIVAPVCALAFDPQNSSRVFAATSGEGVFFSSDNGASWTAINQGLTDLNVVQMSIQPESPYRVLAATYGGHAFWTTVPTAPAPPPTVELVSINDGNAQRSRVTRLQLTFNTQMTFAGPVSSAFTLARNGGGAVNFMGGASLVGGSTVVTLHSFSGTETAFGSLRDGRFTLTAIASQISAGGQLLDGDRNGTPGGNFTCGEPQGLYRLYGDMNGDRRVDVADFGFFSLAYLSPANYNAALDFNLDGRIDVTDFGQFSVRFFTTLP